MDSLDSNQLLMLLGAVAIGAFVLGRMTPRGSAGEDPAERRMRAKETASDALSTLTPSAQDEVDRLIAEKQTIAAVKLVRERTGLGLKEAKDAVDARRSVLGLR